MFPAKKADNADGLDKNCLARWQLPGPACRELPHGKLSLRKEAERIGTNLTFPSPGHGFRERSWISA